MTPEEQLALNKKFLDEVLKVLPHESNYYELRELLRNGAVWDTGSEIVNSTLSKALLEYFDEDHHNHLFQFIMAAQTKSESLLKKTCIYIALDYAALKGDDSLVKNILAADTALLLKEHLLENVLFTASAHGHAEIVTTLIECNKYSFKIDLNAKHPLSGKTAMHLAAEKCHVQVIKNLKNNGADATLLDDRGVTPLNLAIWGKCKETTKILEVINLLSDQINVKDEEGNTPLHRAVLKRNIAIVEKLIELGSEIDPVSKGICYTPLHYAAKYRQLDIASKLVALGADVNAQSTTSGDTPLHLAASSYASSEVKTKMAKLFLDAGADSKIVNNDGKTPLEIARSHFDDESCKALDVPGSYFAFAEVVASHEAYLKRVEAINAWLAFRNLLPETEESNAGEDIEEAAETVASIEGIVSSASTASEVPDLSGENSVCANLL